MLAKTKTAWRFLVTSAAVGSILTITLGQSTQAQEQVNSPRGRTPAAIVDGEYPASYFPNTELLGADEMRITALGTGMPNQTKAAVSISYLVELGNGNNFLFDMGLGSMGTCSPYGLIFRSSIRCLPAISTLTTWATLWDCILAAGCPVATRRSTCTVQLARAPSSARRPSSTA